MRPPENGRPSKLNNTANAGRIVRGRNGRKILPAFLLTICRGTCHRRDTAGKENAPKSIRRRSRNKLCKSRWDDTAGKSSRERQAPALYAAVRVRCRSYGVSYILRSVAGRITGHRRSLPQPSSAAWCPRLLTRAEVKTSVPQRTDLAQVKRDRHTGKPRKARNSKAFRLRQSIISAEIRRKRLSLPTGEVRPSEHDYDYKEISLYDRKRHLQHPHYPT